MKRIYRILGFMAVLGGAAIVLVTMATAGDRRAADALSCKDRMVIHGTPGSGDKTEEAALQRVGLLLTNVAPEFPADSIQTRAAILSNSGPDRYEKDPGNLFIDDELVAEFVVERQDDGTYVVGDVTTCAPLPVAGEATPTPVTEG